MCSSSGLWQRLLAGVAHWGIAPEPAPLTAVIILTPDPAEPTASESPEVAGDWPTTDTAARSCRARASPRLVLNVDVASGGLSRAGGGGSEIGKGVAEVHEVYGV